MSNYRRVFVPGGTWFFTVNLLDRRQTLLISEIVRLRQAIHWTKRRRPFRIEAMVILPDHLHAIWTLPPGDTDYPTRWRLLKSRFSRSLPKTESIDMVRHTRGERAIWQRRYWEHHIRDDVDYSRHVDYCYFNPIKHELVTRISEWPYSTYHRDLRVGRIAPDFDIGRSIIDLNFE